jgi:hypothetical protein
MRFSLFASTTLASLALTSSIAAAQPAATQPAAAPLPEVPAADAPRELNPGLALGLSLGVTAAGYTAMIVGSDEQMALTVPGMLAAGLGPTAGHWYQGRIITRGLVARAAGAVAMGYGLSRLEFDCERNCRNTDFSDAMLLAGLAAFAVGSVDDIVFAPIEAHKTNRKHRARAIENLSLAPQVTEDRVGFALAGSF